MAFKVLFFAVLLSIAFCQQNEDDGSYNPEKYEKPYENLIDESSPEQAGSASPAPNAFQQTQQGQQFQQAQQIQPFQQVQQTPQFQQQQIPQFQQQQQQIPQFQQQQQLAQFQQAQQIPSFQQLQQSQPVQQAVPVQPFQQSVQPQNPFPNNPFFQRLLSPSNQQPQVGSFPQQPQQAPLFQPQTPSFVPQQAPVFQPSAAPAAARQPAPVAQPLEEGQVVQTATNYHTDDGHQRTESVDGNGNVLGQYSYVDPNGKTITVKYSAGKDGFKVQGDHIPKAPEPQPQIAQANFNAPQQINDIQSQFNPAQQRFGPQQFTQNPSAINPSQYQFSQHVRNIAQVPQFSQPAGTAPLGFNSDGSYNFQSGFQ